MCRTAPLDEGNEFEGALSDMEDQVTRHLAQHLLEDHFHSKRSMVEKLCISYRALLRLFHGTQSDRDTEGILFRIIWYSMAEQLPPQELLQGFAIQ